MADLATPAAVQVLRSRVSPVRRVCTPIAQDAQEFAGTYPVSLKHVVDERTTQEGKSEA